MRHGTSFALEVNPKVPPELERLTELAYNLWYSWNRPAREIFPRLHPQLWDSVAHSPPAFLRNIDERRLQHAAQDQEFMNLYRSVMAAYDVYHADSTMRNRPAQWQDSDLVAYFCAEFGLHESLPIYSGGLGILAGDHCKAASDMRLPFIGVGLLYRQGYFAQTMDADGGQIVTYTDSDFSTLPITLMMAGNEELRVTVEFPGRVVALRVWRARVGHVYLYFLDSDVAPNSPADRGITFRLYGGDRTTRIEQEIILGVGGARALRALGINPTVWHINEGHAAFLILDRICDLVARGIPFAVALESVASNIVFTTHTPVPAGHDRFDPALMELYFGNFGRECGFDTVKLLGLGRPPEGGGFDMTALGVRGSRFHNAVSRIHARVSSTMLQNLWPQIPADENAIEYVTNGVHAPTFLAPEWSIVFEQMLGADWVERLDSAELGKHLDQLPDEKVWEIHQQLKSQMLHLLRHHLSVQHFRNRGTDTRLERRLAYAGPERPNVLTIGFARRFATYKRAELLLNDLDRLRRIVTQPGRPVLFVFAGKAHPADAPGQQLIREVARVGQLPEFEDKLLVVEGYDLHLARRLVFGVDVWLNTPIYGFEASGTSGMKAGMNGVLNLSVLDGWWDEAYERGIGWAIKPAAQDLDQNARDREDANALYDLLENQVIPLYYNRHNGDYPRAWIAMAKRSIAIMLARFSTTRMLNEYVHRFYSRAAHQGRQFTADGHGEAAKFSEWKAHLHAVWPHVSVSVVESMRSPLAFGETTRVSALVQLAGLRPEDLVVELIVDRPATAEPPEREGALVLAAEGPLQSDGCQRYTLEFMPDFCGRANYSVRVYPYHELLAHRFELGLMIWA